MGIARLCAGQEFLPLQPSAPPSEANVWDDYYRRFSEEDGIRLANNVIQPPPGQLNAGAAQPTMSRSATGGRQSGIRLASVPNMFGDLALATTTTQVQFNEPTIGATVIAAGTAQIPLGAGTRTGKLAENDIGLPMDRIFFSYNHFENVFAVSETIVSPFPASVTRSQSIDRYTIGFEKTFFDGWSSVQVRMPFNGTFDTQLFVTGVNGGNVGNLAVVLKRLLYEDDNLGIGCGLAIETPTASDIDSLLGPVNLRFVNEAVHLMPFLGFAYSPGDPTWGWGNSWFFTGFLQFDAVANGNPVQFVGPGGVVLGEIGKLNEQNLLFVDLAAGYWLYRDPEAPRVTGLALISELHYTTSSQDSDILNIGGPIPGPPGAFAGAMIGNPDNRFDVFNATIGLQALLFEASSLRVAGVFPLGSRDDQRFFDSEVQVQFNRRF